MAPRLDSYFKEVDKLSETFIDRLRKAVAIPSVSAEDERRKDVVRVKKFSPRLTDDSIADHLARCQSSSSMN